MIFCHGSNQTKVNKMNKVQKENQKNVAVIANAKVNLDKKVSATEETEVNKPVKINKRSTKHDGKVSLSVKNNEEINTKLKNLIKKSVKSEEKQVKSEEKSVKPEEKSVKAAVAVNIGSINVSNDCKIECAPNPKRAGSKAHTRYASYENAKTIGEYLECGGLRADLRYDLLHNFLIVQEVVINGIVVPNPKLAK